MVGNVIYHHILPASFIGVTVNFIPCLEHEISVEVGCTLHLTISCTLEGSKFGLFACIFLEV